MLTQTSMTIQAADAPSPPATAADHDAPQGKVAQIAPLVEGGLLALLVLASMTLGGETVRTGYEGYLQVATGEAVLSGGLLPESPYHAGATVPAATLYPTLGVLVGRLFGGPLWGFAILQILAAALFAPALDSLGRSLKLSTAARRLVFVSAVLLFNGLGWLGALHQAGGDLMEAIGMGEAYMPPMPIISLMPLSLPDTGFGWDARLQAFLPGMLEIAAFALTLPFLLLAVSWSLRDGVAAQRRAAICAGIAVALDPQVGGIAALAMLLHLAVGLMRGRAARDAAVSAAIFLAIALPFLLPTMLAPGGPPSTPFEFMGAGGWANLLGPLALLLPLAALGLREIAPRGRRVVAIVAGACMLATLLDFPADLDRRWVRVAALFLALPAGALLAQLSRRSWGIALVGVLLVGSLPTTVRAFQAYRNWDLSELLIIQVVDGRFEVKEEKLRAWPPGIAASEAELPDDAILFVHPGHPGTRIGGLMSGLGNALVPVFQHPLYVDAEQRLNRGFGEELERRQQLCIALWGRPGTIPMGGLSPTAALAEIRSEFPARTLAMVVTDRPAADELGLQALGAELYATEAGVRLWVFPPPPAVDAEN